MANKARNNLQESLRDLGPNSTYAANGVVSSTAEASGSPACTPLVGWGFTIGTGIVGKSAATDELSTVTGAFPTTIVTQASDALLNTTGGQVGNQTIAGAVNIQLTPAQAAVVQRGQALWVQGGTPTQPLNGQGGTYGFGALRCAQDAVNGDNVEQVTYPSRTTHVFCYYYAVTPPPVAGTITVTKQVAGVQSGSFNFAGNISYAPGGVFSLSASPGSAGSIQFVRGAVLGTTDPPWTFTEQPTNGWNPPGPAVCTSQNGTSTFTTSGAQTSVELAANDNVTCVYTDTPVALVSGVIAKSSIGGIGSFPFTVTGPNGSATATGVTTQAGTPVDVISSTPGGLVAGPYTATESMPTDFSQTGPGSWALTGVDCNDEAVPFTNDTTASPPTATASYTVVGTTDVGCLFTNTFTPSGTITINKTSLGGTDTFGYAITGTSSAGGSPVSSLYTAAATTSIAGVPVTAAPSGGSLPTTNLAADPTSSYTIQETMPAPGPAGSWEMVSADCGPNQVSVDTATASVNLTLSEANPDATCDFTNRLDPPGSFDITKTTTANQTLRPDPAQIDYTCSDGSNGSFQVAAGSGSGDLGSTTSVVSETCTATEAATGTAGADVDTSATISVNAGPPQPYVLGTNFTVAPGTSTTIAIVNTFEEPSGGGPKELAATGANGASWIASAAAIAAIAAGGAAVEVTRRRKRKPSKN